MGRSRHALHPDQTPIIMSTKKYRVWIEQINQTVVEVRAKDRNEAVEKALRKWKRETSGSAKYVEQITKENP